MPILPKLKARRTSRLMTDVFYGYDHHLKIEDGAWYEQTNMSADEFPLFAPRKKRGTVAALTKPGGLIEKDALCYVADGTLYVNSLPTSLTGLSEGEKQLVGMGAYIVIFPDKKYYNTEDANDYGSMEATWTSTNNAAVSYAPCRADGSAFASQSVGDTEPEEGSVELWIDTGGSEPVAMSWSISTGGWVTIDVYTKITFTTQGQIPALFKANDGITISGSDKDAINGSKVLRACGGAENSESDWIVVVGLLGSFTTQSSGAVTITRSVPSMDFVCEAQNRLWGCKYGIVGGKVVNEIYGSALGDFKNWNTFQGLSTDSWAASVGSDGQWTGAIGYLGNPVFFKENRIHEVVIDSGGAHQLRETACRGVQKGSSKSLCVVGETLYYKSRTDVCAWQGGFPESVSRQLGSVKYYEAAAGAFGEKYYISMKDGGNLWSLFTYDIKKGLWCREDALHASHFAQVDDELYAIDAGTNKLLALNGTTGTAEPSLNWAAETGIQAYEFADKKYLSRYDIRLMISQGATVTVKLEYDSSGTWVTCGSLTASAAKTGTVTLPVRPRRCDHLRMRLEGTGDVKIFSVARILEMGSDV